MAKFQIMIGRAETLDVVGTVLNVPAKIDSGAYRSSIHCRSVKEVESKGEKRLKVELLGHPVSPVVYPMEFTSYRTVSVTNSFGHEEKRFEIDLRIKLGPKIVKTPFTLSDRSNNLFPILVGRKLLKGRFIIDTAKSNIDRLKLKKDFGIKSPVDEEDLE